MALAHAVGDKVEAAYRRGDLFDKRRQLAEDWAQYCAWCGPAARSSPFARLDMMPDEPPPGSLLSALPLVLLLLILVATALIDSGARIPGAN